MAHTYRAVIKGNTTQAIYAAQSRGFAIVGIVKNGPPDGSGTTILKIEHNQNTFGSVVQWLSEGPTQPPFPPGALLFYGDDKTGEEKKKVWLAKQGWAVDDDLDGLSAGPPPSLKTPLAEYDLGDTVVTVFDGGRHYSFIVEITQLRNGKPEVVWSKAVAENFKEDAARFGLLYAMRDGIPITSTALDNLKQAIRDHRSGTQKKKGWEVSDDLDAIRHYEVVVGNIGSVYHGPDLDEARHKFDYYVEQSKLGSGRAGGEPVVLFEDDEIVSEFEPKKGWEVDDDLDGLLESVQDKKPSVEYVIEDVIVSVYDTLQNSFFVTIVRVVEKQTRSGHSFFRQPLFAGLISAETKERAALEAVIRSVRSGHNVTGKPILAAGALPLIKAAIRDRLHGLDGAQAFHPWSVSTLTPGLHGKPTYRYFDDFGVALDYARDRARKGKRVRDGGKAYFILGYTANPDGAVAYRVLRARLGAEQREGSQHYTEKREFVLVQEANGTLPHDPTKTRWKMNKEHSIEILDAETEKARKKPFPRR